MIVLRHMIYSMYLYISKNFIFFILLFFSGQTIAATFINCCSDLDKTLGSSEEEHCQGMVMKSDSNQMGMDTEHSISMFNAQGDNECSHQCESCIAANVIIQDVRRNFQPTQLSSIFNYQFLLPVSNLESPFRPPISA